MAVYDETRATADDGLVVVLSGHYMVFGDLGKPLQRQLRESIGALVAGWPGLSWSERRCTFYH